MFLYVGIAVFVIARNSFNSNLDKSDGEYAGGALAIFTCGEIFWIVMGCVAMWVREWSCMKHYVIGIIIIMILKYCTMWLYLSKYFWGFLAYGMQFDNTSAVLVDFVPNNRWTTDYTQPEQYSDAMTRIGWFLLGITLIAEIVMCLLVLVFHFCSQAAL